MIMQLSARNLNLAKYIVEHTDFCPVSASFLKCPSVYFFSLFTKILATGLSALYSELPQKLAHNSDDIIILTREDVNKVSSLCQFINSLEFCNNVIQVS